MYIYIFVAIESNNYNIMVKVYIMFLISYEEDE